MSILPFLFNFSPIILEPSFNLIFGLRYDIHNNLGSFFTPRLHFRYQLNDNFSLKGSFGTGRKIANIFAENQIVFLSNRNRNSSNNLLR